METNRKYEMTDTEFQKLLDNYSLSDKGIIPTKKVRAKEILDELKADDGLMSEFNLQLRMDKIKKIKDGNK